MLTAIPSCDPTSPLEADRALASGHAVLTQRIRSRGAVIPYASLTMLLWAVWGKLLLGTSFFRQRWRVPAHSSHWKARHMLPEPSSACSIGPTASLAMLLHLATASSAF